MRTRDHNWYDPKKKKTLYSFQVHHHGKWRHVAENGKPLIYPTEAARDAKRREYRGKKSTDGSVAPLRDAYDTLNEQLQALRLQTAGVQAEQAARHLPVHIGVLADIEQVGTTCLDSGRCHHGCRTTCFRRQTCVPLSIASSYLNDDWSLKAPTLVVAGQWLNIPS